MADDPPNKASAFFVDRLVQPLLSGLNPSFAPVSENGKPGLSINLMTRNFRRFSARFLRELSQLTTRVGVVFMVQSKIEDVLNWKSPIETISAMTIFSLGMFNPNLLILFPLFVVVFALLIPYYQVRHPPPPMNLSNAPTEVTQAISPAPQPAKPVPELSRDFFMNMRDIQNTMDDFNSAYDLIRGYVLYVMTFSNEPLSSTVLAFSALGGLVLLAVVQFLPLRLIILVLGNSAILACNPILFKYIVTKYLPPEEIARIKQRIDQFVKEDYISPPMPSQVTFQVEIFESRRLLPPIPPNTLPDWSASKFSPFPPQSTNSTEKLAVISAPPGYTFAADDWTVDLDKKWAYEREVSDASGYWIVERDDIERERDGWVVYESGGWKVRRLTRGVGRAIEKG